MLEMENGPAIKIRGIYATALTHFFLQKGLKVVQPSRPVRKRFPKSSNLSRNSDHRIMINDLKNKQGVQIEGSYPDLRLIRSFMDGFFWDAVYRWQEGKEAEWLEVEFPGVSKHLLDDLRNEVQPTIEKHHQLRIINSRLVDLAENVNLAMYPKRMAEISLDLQKRLIWSEYWQGRELDIEHVKPDGSLIYLSKGKILQAIWDKRSLVLERSRYSGRGSYNGLDIDKHKGDYAVSRLQEGAWSFWHDYYRSSGEFIGRYMNINTPAEFYPDRVRYVDLEVDVVVWPDKTRQLIDREELLQAQAEGKITESLAQRALAEAEEAAGLGLGKE